MYQLFLSLHRSPSTASAVRRTIQHDLTLQSTLFRGRCRWPATLHGVSRLITGSTIHVQYDRSCHDWSKARRRMDRTSAEPSGHRKSNSDRQCCSRWRLNSTQLLALVHTVVLICACNAGLGKHDDAQRQQTFETRSKVRDVNGRNTRETFDDHEQLRYTADLLATAAISCSKGSAAAIVHQIVGIVHKRLQHSLLVATGLFAVFAMFAKAFQCRSSAPQYWASTPEACNHGALEYTIVVFNMVTDIWLAVAALPIIWRLQTTTPKRLRVMALLGARIL